MIQWPNIRYPLIALSVFFGIGVMLSSYGVTQATMYLLDIFLGIGIYKLIISWIPN